MHPYKRRMPKCCKKRCVGEFPETYKMYENCCYDMVKVCSWCGHEYDHHRYHVCPRCGTYMTDGYMMYDHHLYSDPMYGHMMYDHHMHGGPMYDHHMHGGPMYDHHMHSGSMCGGPMHSQHTYGEPKAGKDKCSKFDDGKHYNPKSDDPMSGDSDM